MAEVAVVKHPKKEGQELTRVLGFETPLSRGNLFTVNPFALMRQFTEKWIEFLARPRKQRGMAPLGLPSSR